MKKACSIQNILKKQKGTAFLESLVLLPIVSILIIFLFFIPLLHIHKWNEIVAHEELKICRQNLNPMDCEGRDQIWIRGLEILKLNLNHIIH